jgi:hypothetical protein
MTSSDMEAVIKTYNSVSGQHINIGKEIHYRKSGNHLSLNETAVYYAKHQFNQKDVLSKRFEIEK